MKIIILEGIATSGKTSIIKYLSDFLDKNNFRFSIIGEDKTLMPILHNQDKQVSIDLLKLLINQALAEDREFIIFDRLFFTHIFRTNSDYSEFREIEQIIKNYTILGFLKIDEDQIPTRLEYARQHRDQDWNEYISKKGNDEEIYQYYIQQQRTLENLLTQTELNYKVYNTTNLQFEEIAKDLVESLFEKE
jgi:thymidylate kinase